MVDYTITINSVQVPRFLYGMPRKEDDTEQLTELALQAGFRGIDTATGHCVNHWAVAIVVSADQGRFRDAFTTAAQIYGDTNG